MVEQAWQWIWDNRTWLFSGGGLAGISAIVILVRWLARRSRKRDADTAGTDTDSQDLANFLWDENSAAQRELGAFEERERGYQESIAAKDSQIAELRGAIEALEKRQGDPGTDKRRDEALALLRVGDTSAAEEIFEEILKAKSAAGAAANREAAEAARHLGVLAFLHDTQKAIHAYTRATELDPDDPHAWNQLGVLRLRAGDLAAAEAAFERVLALGNRTADKALVATATGNLGVIHKTHGDLDKAEEYFEKSLALNEALGLKEGMANAYGNLAGIHQTRGDLKKAEAFLEKSLEIDKGLGRRKGMANSYGNLSLIYQRRGDLDKAEAFQERSLALNEALDRKEGVASNFGNLGSIHLLRGDLDKAEAFIEKSLEIEKALDRKEGMAKAYGNLGTIHLLRGDFDKAEAFQEKSLEIDQFLGRREGMATTCANLGQIRKARGNIEEACRLWAKALALFEEIGASDKISQVAGWMTEAGCDEAPASTGEGQPKAD